MHLFKISKSFVDLNLHPLGNGLQISYQPTINGTSALRGNKYCELHIPMAQIGQLWAAVKTLIQSRETVDLQLSLAGNLGGHNYKLKLFSERENSSSPYFQTWLQILDSNQARRIRKIKLTAENLHSLELACKTTTAIGVAQLTPAPQVEANSRITHLPFVAS